MMPHCNIKRLRQERHIRYLTCLLPARSASISPYSSTVMVGNATVGLNTAARTSSFRICKLPPTREICVTCTSTERQRQLVATSHSHAHQHTWVRFAGNCIQVSTLTASAVTDRHYTDSWTSRPTNRGVGTSSTYKPRACSTIQWGKGGVSCCFHS